VRTLRRNPRPAILLSPLVALALGCSGATPPPAATDLETPVPPGVAPDGAARPDDATPRDTFEPPARPDPAPDPLRPGDCDPITAAAIGAVVSAQLSALARDDLDAAYALTRPSSTRTSDRDTFATMIRDDHPYLLDGPDHRLDECWASSRSGYLVVGVRTGTGEIVLRYDVTEDPHSGWLIDAITAIPGLVLPDDQRTQPASTSSSAHAA